MSNRRGRINASMQLRLRALAAGVLASVVAALILAAGAAGSAAGQALDFAIPTGASQPEAIVAGPDGNLWFTEFASARIGEINPTTHAIQELATPTPGSGPLGLAVGPDGNLWFTEFNADRIGELNAATGAISEFPIPTGAAPVDIVAGADGNLWFTVSANPGYIDSINPATHAIATYPAPTTAAMPFGIAAGPDGDIWFTEKSASRIGTINPTTHVASDFATSTASSAPNSIVTGPSGSLWFTESAANKIGLVDATSHAITEIALAASTAPTVIVPGPDGQLWFTDNGTAQIGELNPVTHGVTSFATPTAASAPVGIVTGADGDLWFTEASADRVATIGAGASAAVSAAPLVSGSAQPAATISCQGGAFAPLAGQQPSQSAFPFDGYRWLRDGAVIAGATSATYTVTAADVGHQLACALTATYPLLGTTAIAGSSAVTVYPGLAAALTASSVIGPRASVTISCQGAPGQSCSGALSLTAHVTTRAGRVIAIAARGRTTTKTTVETVGSGTYSVAAGASATVALVLDSAGKKLLQHRYRVPAALAIGGTTAIAATLTFSYARLHVQDSYTWAFSHSGALLRDLSLSKLPAKASVTVRCHGKGCPFAKRHYAPAHTTLTLTGALAHQTLAPGATLEIEVGGADDVSELFEFDVHAGTVPREHVLCQAPGAARASACA